MKKKTILTIAVVMGFSFLALLYMQLGYIEQMVKMKREQFDESVSKALYGANGKAVTMDATDGFCKLLVDNATGQLLGCHIIGAHSSDIIHEVTALMNLGATVEQARDIIHAHPTLSEVFQMALHSIKN